VYIVKEGEFEITKIKPGHKANQDYDLEKETSMPTKLAKKQSISLAILGVGSMFAEDDALHERVHLGTV